MAVLFECGGVFFSVRYDALDSTDWWLTVIFCVGHHNSVLIINDP